MGAVGIVSFSQANNSARDGKRRGDIESARQALMLRRQETGSYYVLTGTSATNFNNSIDNLVSTGYLSPPSLRDPANTGLFVYTMSGTATTFCICADLQNDNGNSSNTSCSFVSTPNTGTHYCARQP